MSSGSTVEFSHTWANARTYAIRARAKDIHNNESEWSGAHLIEIKTETLQPPANLRIETAGADSLSINLSWIASPTEDIDGYIIRLGALELGRVTGTSLTHTPASLGIYRVSAYRGNEESGEISASTELVIRENQGPVWWFDAPSDTGYSAYGWDETGSGTLYRFSSSDPDNRPFIDFWMDTLTPVKGTDKIFSPRDFGGAWVDARETWFYTTGNTGEAGFVNTKIAPGAGHWFNYAEITAIGRVYILHLTTGHYVKILVTDRKIEGHHNFTFKYGFQPVKGFRRLGDD